MHCVARLSLSIDPFWTKFRFCDASDGHVRSAFNKRRADQRLPCRRVEPSHLIVEGSKTRSAVCERADIRYIPATEARDENATEYFLLDWPPCSRPMRQLRFNAVTIP